MHAIRYLSLLALLGALFFSGPIAGEGIAFSRGTVQLVPPGKAPLSFKVEFAITPAERRQGLMYRASLDEKAGMLFVFNESALRHFWMKNTPLSLDILFFTKERRLAHIVPNAEPNNDKVISSFVPVQYVLELEAGSVSRFGLELGTALVLPAGSLIE